MKIIKTLCGIIAVLFSFQPLAAWAYQKSDQDHHSLSMIKRGPSGDDVTSDCVHDCRQ